MLRKTSIGLSIVVASLLCLSGVNRSVQAQPVDPSHATIGWVDPRNATVEYEFRLMHYASNGWIDLGKKPGAPPAFLYDFAALPDSPDRWVCVDGRQTKPVVTAWLSTLDKQACNQIAAGNTPLTVLVPIPTPVPVPVPTPTPTPAPAVAFSHVTFGSGTVSVDYDPRQCTGGTGKATSAVNKTTGLRTVTLSCLVK